MKQQVHLADECLMTARERPVEFAALDGRKSAKAAGHAYPIPVINELSVLSRLFAQGPLGRWVGLH